MAHFQVALNLSIKVRPGAAIHMKIEFNLHVKAGKSHFHMKGARQGLSLRKSLNVIRK